MADTGAGKRFGAFRTLSQLGAGAQGAVYRAVAEGHPTLPDGTVVALKVIPQQATGTRPDVLLAAYRPLLGKEIHPCLVKYLDAFLDQADGKSWICAAMEHVEGRPLSDLIAEKTGGLIWTQAWPILRDALDAFSALVGAGLLHRDIKPGNLLLTPAGKVKIIDLDLAPKGEDNDADRTVAWQGSLEYMAPDFVNLKGFTGDETSDVFSFAVLAFELVAGARPFTDLGERPDLGYVQRWRKGNDTHPDFRASSFRILDALQSALSRALQQEREQRTPTFAALKADLEKVKTRTLEFHGGESYELLDLLGRGGFGEVYKGRRVSNGEVVAIKHLHSQEYSKRFLKEAAILKQYAHPHIVGYGGLHSRESKGEGPEYFLVMEYLSGETLDKRIRRAPDGMPAREVMGIFTAYCKALHHLHASEHQIIHRDIKPGNLYAPDGQPEQAKLFDLGIARDVSGTQTFGHIPGTLNYMAPEFALADGGRGTPQSDIYALGFCLYECLVGGSVVPKLPRDLDQAYIAFFKRSQRPLVIDFDKPVFREFPALMRVVAKSLAYDPKSRYASADEMRKDLEAILDPKSRESTTGDYSVTIGQVISPKLVIDQKWADENMKDWDENKFVPDKVPKELGGDGAPGGRKAFFALVACLMLAIGGVVYLKFIKPPEVQGVNEQWAAQLLKESAAAREAASVPELEGVRAALTAMRGQPDAAKSAADLDAIQAALRARTLALASNTYAEASGMVSRADFAAAGDLATRLEDLSSFATEAFQAPEPAAWAEDIAARIASGSKLMAELTSAKQAMAARLDAAAASVKDGDVSGIRKLVVEITAIPTAEWARTAPTPEVLPKLEALRARVAPVLQAEIARRDDPAGRAARLADLASWIPNQGRVLEVSGLSQALAEANRAFIWQVANPTELPLTLASPLVPAGTVLAPGASTNLLLAAEQAADVQVAVTSGPAHEPGSVSLSLKGGGGAVSTLPKLGLKAVNLAINKAAFTPGSPRPKFTLKGAGLKDPSDPTDPADLVKNPIKLAPGTYTARFTREDFNPIELPVEAKPGTPTVTLEEPAEADWVPAPGLALLNSLEPLAAAGDASLSAKLEAPSLAALVWPAHQARVAALRARASELMLAAIPAAVDAAYARVDAFLASLVQVRDPMTASRTRFRALEPYAGPAPVLSLPNGWEKAALAPAVREHLALVQPFLATWESVVSGPGRAAVAAALSALGQPLATDAAAALTAASPAAGPAAGAASHLAHRWRAHLAFERDFVSAETVLTHLEAFQKAGGRANAYDALLGMWAAHAIWLNAVESVKDDTRLGGKRHTAESDQAVAVVRRLNPVLDALPAAEMDAALAALREKAASTPNLRGAPLLVMTGFAKLRGGAAWKPGLLAALDAEKTAFESAASPADASASKRRLANLNYLLLEVP